MTKQRSPEYRGKVCLLISVNEVCKTRLKVTEGYSRLDCQLLILFVMCIPFAVTEICTGRDGRN